MSIFSSSESSSNPSTSISSSSLPHGSSQQSTDCFNFLFSCVFTCLLKWSLRMNLFPHSGQPNLFSPVWVRRWRCSSSERVKLLPQNNQLQMKGRSPECHRRWAFKWDVFPYTFPHPGMWQICCFFFAGLSEFLEFWQFGHLQRRHRRVGVMAAFIPCITEARWAWYWRSATPPVCCEYRKCECKSGLTSGGTGTDVLLVCTLHQGMSASEAGEGDSCLCGLCGLCGCCTRVTGGDSGEFPIPGGRDIVVGVGRNWRPAASTFCCISRAWWSSKLNWSHCNCSCCLACITSSCCCLMCCSGCRGVRSADDITSCMWIDASGDGRHAEWGRLGVGRCISGAHSLRKLTGGTSATLLMGILMFIAGITVCWKRNDKIFY